MIGGWTTTSEADVRAVQCNGVLPRGAAGAVPGELAVGRAAERHWGLRVRARALSRRGRV